MIYNNLSNMTDDENLVYTSLLISLKDTEFNNDSVLGMIDDTEEIEGNILAQKLYSEEKLVNSIEEYSDYYGMLKDLYNGDIDAIFVPSNYVTLFNEEEDYQNIASDTKVLYKYSEERENQDLVLSSNKTFEEPLTFLLLGVDSEDDGLNANAAFNGDTLMIITFNPDTLQTTMVSIPRDTFVPIACRSDNYAKINSSAAYGTSCVIDTVSNFLDVDIDYYVKINFKGVVELVDAIGGIEVDVEAPTYNADKYDGMMCEQNSDRQFGDKLVCIEPGWQTLNGEQALAYARNRHLYIGSDLDRIRHQQQVVEAIANKALGFSSVKNLQENLNKLNFNCGTPDGTFGAGTETALKNFQKANKLTVDGLAGSATLNAIQKAVNNLKQPVTPSKGLSENGFKLLASYEATSAVKDKKGNVVSIPILDVGDGMYTIGIGNTVKKTDTKTIQEYKEKYGVDVTKVGAQVDIKTCMKIYNDHVNTYTSTVDNLLKRHNYTASQNEYDALVIAVYNRPALAKEGHALDTLIKNNNRNKDDWRTTLINEYKGLKNWNTYGKGWSNRIEDELELYFDNDYVRNH